MHAATRPDSRGRVAREELRRIDKESARLKREISRMRVQLEAAVHDENISRLHNLVAEKSKEHEVLQTENRLLERQLHQLQPAEDEAELDEQRAISEEHATLSVRIKKYQKLQRIDDLRRQQLQKEYAQASMRADRLRRELKAEQVTRGARAPPARAARALRASPSAARASACACRCQPSGRTRARRANAARRVAAAAQERVKRMEKRVQAGHVDTHDGGPDDDAELAAERAEVASLEKRLAATRTERSADEKRVKIKARDALVDLAAVRKEKERLLAQLAVRAMRRSRPRRRRARAPKELTRALRAARRARAPDAYPLGPAPGEAAAY